MIQISFDWDPSKRLDRFDWGLDKQIHRSLQGEQNNKYSAFVPFNVGSVNMDVFHDCIQLQSRMSYLAFSLAF